MSIYESGIYEGGVFVAMELIVGSTLREWSRGRPPTSRAVVDALIAIGEGLAAAHARGLVHRDIKPENVVVTKTGVPKIVDFGLAQDADASVMSTTVRGGTAGYAPPEYFDDGIVSPALDQFSYCVLVYETLFGEKPFEGDDTRALRDSIRRGAMRGSSGGLGALAAYRRLLVRGLSARPEARFESMRELVDGLRRVRTSARRRFGVIAPRRHSDRVRLRLAATRYAPQTRPSAAMKPQRAPTQPKPISPKLSIS